MAGEIKINDVSIATESGGTVTLGNTTLGSTVVLGTNASPIASNLVLAAGNGIDFSAASGSAAGSSSAVLDDYEEGTFTLTIPNWGFTQSHSGFSNLQYIKIARSVFIQGSIELSSSGYASAYSRFTGIPFGCIYGVGNYGSGVIAGGGIGGQITFGSNSMYFYRANNTVSSSSWEFAAVYYTTY